MQKLLIPPPEICNLFFYKTSIQLFISPHKTEPVLFNELDTQLCCDISTYSKEKDFFKCIQKLYLANFSIASLDCILKLVNLNIISK